MTPELFLAILGLQRVLGKTKFKVLKQDITAALKLKDDMSKMLDDFLKGEETSRPEPLKLEDIEWIKDAAQTQNAATRLQEILPVLQDAGIDVSVGMMVVNLIEYMRVQMPGDELSEGVIASRIPKSSISGDFRLLWAARLVDDPLHLITLMQRRQLTKTDTRVMLTVYPALYEELVDMLIEKILEHPERPLNRKIKSTMAVLLEMPVINAKTLQAYQAAPDQAPLPAARTPEISPIGEE